MKKLQVCVIQIFLRYPVNELFERYPGVYLISLIFLYLHPKISSIKAYFINKIIYLIASVFLKIALLEFSSEKIMINGVASAESWFPRLGSNCRRTP